MAATPKWDLDSAINRGQEAQRLLADNAEALTPELDEGLGAQLDADLAFLDTETDDKSLADQRTATATERETAKDAHDLIMLIRNAVQRSAAGTDSLRAAMEVGRTLNAGDTKGLLRVLGAVATNADALRRCKVPAVSIAEAADLAARLQGADTGQTGAKQGRSTSTDARTEARLRLEAAVDAIHVAGLFLFRKDAAKRARFEALVSSSGPGPQPPTDPQPQPGPTDPTA